MKKNLKKILKYQQTYKTPSELIKTFKSKSISINRYNDITRKTASKLIRWIKYQQKNSFTNVLDFKLFLDDKNYSKNGILMLNSILNVFEREGYIKVFNDDSFNIKILKQIDSFFDIIDYASKYNIMSDEFEIPTNI